MTTLTAYRTVPQHEYKAQSELKSAGHHAVVPSQTIRRRIGAKRIDVREPICRGYVFASGHLHEAKHVKGKVGHVHAHEMQRLEAIGSAVQPDPDYVAPWLPGDLATVISGPLCGTDVVFLDQSGRVARVEGMMMGAHRSLSLHISQIQRRSPP